MKRLIIGIVILIVLLVGGLSAAIMTLNSIDWSEYQEPIAKAVKDATGRELRFSGALNVTIGLSPGISADDVTLQNAAWASRDDMLILEHVEVQLKLLPLIFGRIELNRLEITGFDLMLETDQQGNGNWQFESPDAEASVAVAEEPADDDLLTSVILNKAVIQNVTIAYIDGMTGTSQRFSIEKLVARMDSATAPLVIDLVAFYGDERVEVAGEIRGVAGLIEGGPLGLDVTVNALGTTVQIDGVVDKPLEADGIDIALDINGKSLAALSMLAGTELPDVGAYRIAAHITGTAERFNVTNLAIGIADMQINGDLQADLAGDLLRLKATLRSPRIDLTRLSPADATTAHEPEDEPRGELGRQPNDRVFPDDPLPLDAFDALDTIVADVSLAIDELIVDADTTLTNLDVGIHVAPKTVSITPLKLDALGAAITGRVALEAAPDALAVVVKMKISHPAIGDLVEDTGDTLMTGGPLDIDIDVAGSGASVRDIMASLNGSLAVEMGAARFNNKWAQQLIAGVATIVSQRPGQSGDIEPVEINCLTSEFRITDGVARTGSLLIDTSKVSMFGDGRIDLRDESLQLDFDLVGTTVSASSLWPPFLVRGTLASPTGRVDTRALVGKTFGFSVPMTESDIERLDVPAKTGSQRCVQRLVAYEQIQADRARSKPTTAESADQVVESTKQVIDKLRGFFRKK